MKEIKIGSETKSSMRNIALIAIEFVTRVSLYVRNFFFIPRPLETDYPVNISSSQI